MIPAKDLLKKCQDLSFKLGGLLDRISELERFNFKRVSSSSDMGTSRVMLGNSLMYRLTSSEREDAGVADELNAAIYPFVKREKERVINELRSLVYEFSVDMTQDLLVRVKNDEF